MTEPQDDILAEIDRTAALAWAAADIDAVATAAWDVLDREDVVWSGLVANARHAAGWGEHVGAAWADAFRKAWAEPRDPTDPTDEGPA